MAIRRRGEQQTSERSDPIPNLPVGEHEGRLRYVIDLGMYTNEYNGEVKPDVQKLSLGIEIVGETVEIDGKMQPRLLWSEIFNVYYSLTKNGKELPLYQIFDSTAKVGEIADWDKVINEPCNVKVIHVQGKRENSDRIYDNIEGLTAYPAKHKDSVEVGLITDGCTGDAEDESSPAQQAMYGLVSWMFEQRVDGGEATPTPPTPQAVLDNAGDGGIEDEDIPF